MVPDRMAGGGNVVSEVKVVAAAVFVDGEPSVVRERESDGNVALVEVSLASLVFGLFMGAISVRIRYPLGPLCLDSYEIVSMCG